MQIILMNINEVYVKNENITVPKGTKFAESGKLRLKASFLPLSFVIVSIFVTSTLMLLSCLHFSSVSASNLINSSIVSGTSFGCKIQERKSFIINLKQHQQW